MAKIITTDEARRLILEESNGHWFGVTFTKRSNGERREMNCRLGVAKGLKGGPPAYDPNDHGLIWAYESGQPDDAARKSINVEGIKSLRLNGVEYVVAS